MEVIRLEQKKITITRRTVMIASLSAILITTMILAVVSFSIRRLPTDENSERTENTFSADSNIIEEISADNKENSSLVIDEESRSASDVFAESDLSDNNSESSVTESVEESEPDTSEETEFTHGWVINEYGYTYVYNGCGYVQFNYKTSALERYINSFDKLVSVLPESTRVFNITVPVSSTFASIPRDIYTNDNFYNQSQSAFVSTVSARNNEKVIDVPIVSLLEEQYDNGEYVFFKTDKNWTSLAAYTAYSAFCEKAGIISYSIDNFEKVENGDFLGSFYTATKLDSMYESPDSFTCYSTLPTVKTSLTVYDSGMIYTDYKLCENKTSLYTGYNFFLGRNAERYEITTTSKGGSLLIIGDSSACPMIPYLATHYGKIDVINPCEFDGDLEEFLSQREYADCITMCYSTNAVSGEYIPAFNAMTGNDDNE